MLTRRTARRHLVARWGYRARPDATTARLYTRATDNMSLPATPVSYAACSTAECRMQACEAANDAFRGETVYALRKQVTRGILCDTPTTYARRARTPD